MEFTIISKDDLKAKAVVKTKTLPLPQLGENVAVKIKEYTVGDKLAIQAISTIRDEFGNVMSIDAKQDVLMSVVMAIEEPKLNPISDGEWILSLPDTVVAEIIDAARALGVDTQSDYEGLKAALRRNVYIRRLYSMCVNKLHRLPIELSDIPESEFNTALAALEIDAEDEQLALSAKE